MTDRGSGVLSLDPAWHALASRSCVVIAALVALVSLFEDTPVWVASLRGLAAFLVVRWAARTGLAVLEQALRADAEQASRASEDEA